VINSCHFDFVWLYSIYGPKYFSAKNHKSIPFLPFSKRLLYGAQTFRFVLVCVRVHVNESFLKFCLGYYVYHLDLPLKRE